MIVHESCETDFSDIFHFKMGEGEPAPAAPATPAPVIKIFISGNSGSKEV